MRGRSLTCLSDPPTDSVMHYTLFETPIGTCGVVWGERGLTGVHLPDANAARTRASV